MSNILESLKWRYAVKTYDQSKKLDEHILETLKECFRLSPSSYGLQPWHVIVLSAEEDKKRIAGHCYGQKQPLGASHIFVLCADYRDIKTRISNHIKLSEEKRNLKKNSLADYRAFMEKTLLNFSEERLSEWAKRQVYLACGNLLTCAAQLGVDATPMEGFDPKAIDEEFSLNQKGLESVLIVPLGYRSESDGMALKEKVRFPIGDIFT